MQERIRLVELIWDCVAAIPEAVKISPELKARLEERLKELEANPDAGYSWDQVKSRIKDRTWRSTGNFSARALIETGDAKEWNDNST